MNLAVDGQLVYVYLISGELSSYTSISMVIIMVLAADSTAVVDLRFAIGRLKLTATCKQNPIDLETSYALFMYKMTDRDLYCTAVVLQPSLLGLNESPRMFRPRLLLVGGRGRAYG